MNTIELNGTKYVSYEDYEEALKEKEENKTYESKINLDCVLMDETNVSAIGTVELKYGEWHQTKVSTAFLKKVIKGLEAMSFHKDGIETISLVWTKDHPIIIGHLDRKKEKTFVAGYIIAPRREPE